MLARLRTASLDAAAGIQANSRVWSGGSAPVGPRRASSCASLPGFCRDDIMAWCEDEEIVDYVLGLAKNRRLKHLCAGAMAEASAETRKTGKACRPVLRVHLPDTERLVQGPPGGCQGRSSSRTQGRRRDGLSLTRRMTDTSSRPSVRRAILARPFTRASTVPGAMRKIA